MLLQLSEGASMLLHVVSCAAKMLFASKPDM
jgi:hypothetical protein